MSSYERSLKMATFGLIRDAMWEHGPTLRFLFDVLRQSPDTLSSEVEKILTFKIRRIEKNTNNTEAKQERVIWKKQSIDDNERQR